MGEGSSARRPGVGLRLALTGSSEDELTAWFGGVEAALAALAAAVVDQGEWGFDKVKRIAEEGSKASAVASVPPLLHGHLAARPVGRGHGRRPALLPHRQPAARRLAGGLSHRGAARARHPGGRRHPERAPAGCRQHPTRAPAEAPRHDPPRSHHRPADRTRRPPARGLPAERRRHPGRRRPAGLDGLPPHRRPARRARRALALRHLRRHRLGAHPGGRRAVEPHALHRGRGRARDTRPRPARCSRWRYRPGSSGATGTLGLVVVPRLGLGLRHTVGRWRYELELDADAPGALEVNENGFELHGSSPSFERPGAGLETARRVRLRPAPRSRRRHPPRASGRRRSRPSPSSAPVATTSASASQRSAPRSSCGRGTATPSSNGYCRQRDCASSSTSASRGPSAEGVVIAGGLSTAVTLPIHLGLGPFEIDSVYLALDADVTGRTLGATAAPDPQAGDRCAQGGRRAHRHHRRAVLPPVERWCPRPRAARAEVQGPRRGRHDDQGRPGQGRGLPLHRREEGAVRRRPRAGLRRLQARRAGAAQHQAPRRLADPRPRRQGDVVAHRRRGGAVEAGAHRLRHPHRRGGARRRTAPLDRSPGAPGRRADQGSGRRALPARPRRQRAAAVVDARHPLPRRARPARLRADGEVHLGSRGAG